MELYNFVRGTLAWTATIACLWPLNIPVIAFAYKVRHGPKPLDIDSDEYWTRSTFASLVMALVTAGFIFVDHMLAVWAEFPPGPIHLIVLAGYLAAGTWILTLFFAFDDLAKGLSLLLIYLYLPTFVLFTLNWLLGLLSPNLRFWDWVLSFAEMWLAKNS